tara:strand:+ start:314 stop:517 length:204 start_codon:yes stop_codon:yes gene_type:complete
VYPLVLTFTLRAATLVPSGFVAANSVGSSTEASSPIITLPSGVSTLKPNGHLHFWNAFTGHHSKVIF